MKGTPPPLLKSEFLRPLPADGEHIDMQRHSEKLVTKFNEMRQMQSDLQERIEEAAKNGALTLRDVAYIEGLVTQFKACVEEIADIEKALVAGLVIMSEDGQNMPQPQQQEPPQQQAC